MGYETLSYSKGYNPEIKILHFSFEEGDDATMQVSATFWDVEEFQTYKKEIEAKYKKIENMTTAQETYYSDTGDESNASVFICVSDIKSVRTIIYQDRK